MQRSAGADVSGDALMPNRIFKQARKWREKSRRLGLPATLSGHEWQRAIDYFGGCCAVCGVQLIEGDKAGHQRTLDHWRPLIYGGGTTADNAIPLCQICNDSKGSFKAKRWLRRRYGDELAASIAGRVEAYFEWTRQQQERDS